MLDPLDGLENRPLEAQVAVLATEVRNQRNAISSLGSQTAGVQKALWYLIASIIIGIIVFVATTALRPSHSTPTTPTSASAR
jgi:hypothetical protein